MRTTYIVVGVLAATLILLRQLQPSPAARFAEYVLHQHLISEELIPPSEQSLRILLADTPYRDRWQINRPPRKDFINLYVVAWRRGDRRVQVPEEFERFAGTLAYLGDDNIIAVDNDYTQAILERLGLAARFENPFERMYAQAKIRRDFLLWVIGHELGHLVHRDRASHFGFHAFEQLTDEALQQQRESEADAFFVERLNQNPDALDSVADLLFRVLDHEVISKGPKATRAGPLIEFFDRDAMQILTNGSHPEFVLRAMRAIRLLRLPPTSAYAQLPQWMARFEPRLQSAAPRFSRLRVESQADNADIQVEREGQRFPVYPAPAEIVVEAGDYQVTVSAKGFRPEQVRVHVPPDTVRQVNVELRDDPAPKPAAPAPSPDQAFEQAYYAASRRLNRARYFKLEKLEDAAGWEIDRALEAAPQWSAPLFLSAQWQSERGEYTLAAKTFQRALSLRSQQSPWFDLSYYELSTLLTERTELARKAAASTATVSELSRLGEILGKLGNSSEAARWSQLARERAGGKCRFALGLGDAFAAGHRSEDAAAEYQRSVSCAPQNPQAYLRFGAFRRAEGQVDAAEAAFREAVRLAPSDPDAWEELASFYSQAGRHRDAIHPLQQVVRLKEDDYSAWAVLGRECALSGDAPQAKRSFERSVKEFKDSVEGLTGLGELAIAERAWQRAEQSCLAASKSQSAESPAAWLCLGRVYEGQAEWNKAQAPYEYAIWTEPEESETHSALARVLDRLNLSEAAALQHWMAGELNKGH